MLEGGPDLALRLMFDEGIAVHPLFSNKKHGTLRAYAANAWQVAF